MYKNFIYPQSISKLVLSARKHLRNESTVRDLQKAVQMAEMSIVAIEEKDIRNFLTGIEGRLELILYTIKEEEQIYHSKKIAYTIIDWLEKINKEKKTS